MAPGNLVGHDRFGPVARDIELSSSGDVNPTPVVGYQVVVNIDYSSIEVDVAKLLRKIAAAIIRIKQVVSVDYTTGHIEGSAATVVCTDHEIGSNREHSAIHIDGAASAMRKADNEPAIRGVVPAIDHETDIRRTSPPAKEGVSGHSVLGDGGCRNFGV